MAAPGVSAPGVSEAAPGVSEAAPGVSEAAPVVSAPGVSGAVPGVSGAVPGVSGAVPVVSVTPSRALMDEKLEVLVENLPLGRPVTVHALHLSEDNDYWEAFGHYVSDHRGTVRVSEDLCLGGTYSGKEPMGLFWSLRPVPGSREGLKLRKLDVCSPLLFTLSVYSGHLSEGFGDRAPLASGLTERWYMAPGVRRVPVKEPGLEGTLFIPPGPGPFPGLLDLNGGGGTQTENRAAMLASRGYAAMTLSYLGSGGMDTANLELSHFEAAFNFVKHHPSVKPDRVGVVAFSFGATMTFCLASRSSVVKPSCCVCISGHLHYPRERGAKGLAKMRQKNAWKVRLDENNHLIWRELYQVTEDSEKINMENINCPLLLVCGEDDQNVPSVEVADEIKRMMSAAGKEHLLTRLIYPGTGHIIEVPYSPHFRVTQYRRTGQSKVMLLWGGQTKPHSDAQEDSWRKILDFLQEHLYPRPDVKAKL